MELKERLVVHEDEVNTILKPLASLVHQIQRLHDNSYSEMKESLAQSRDKISVQINILIASIVLVSMVMLLVY